MELIKVSGNSRTSAVAGAIAGVIREHGRADVQAIGAQAVNQAVKALALAQRYLKRDDLEILMRLEFVDITIEDKVRTAIRFSIESRVVEGLSKDADVIA
ncbi:MAG: stage V sporulation protein S [Anaerolineales bacterium]